jgi:hypothetical protein
VKLDVVRSHGRDGTLTVSYRTQDGSAKDKHDYHAKSGTLVFGPGVMRKCIEIEIINDDLPEENNSFTVELFSDEPAALAARHRVCTVTNSPSSTTTSFECARERGDAGRRGARERGRQGEDRARHPRP